MAPATLQHPQQARSREAPAVNRRPSTEAVQQSERAVASLAVSVDHVLLAMS